MVKPNYALWLWRGFISLTQVLVLLMQYGWKTEAFTLYLTCEGRRIWKKWHDAGTKMQKQNVLMISSLRQNI
jgi:hypothetical protein